MASIDVKSLEDLSKRRAPNFTEIWRALGVVREFIVKKGLIIYGGMSIDLALKSAARDEKAGIYGESSVPDYDVLSPNFYEDSLELADELHAAGFGGISAINASHITTRRVRINFEPVADMTFIPRVLWEGLPTIQHGDLRVLHPHFQFLDMHREYTFPLDGPPFESFFFRSKKSMSRYRLLAAMYPIHASISDESTVLKIEKHPLAKSSSVGSKPRVEFLIGGILAYVVYFSEAKKIVDSFANKDISLLFEKVIPALDGKIGIKIPTTKDHDVCLTLYTYADIELAAIISGETEWSEYERYLDDIAPARLVADGIEIMSTKNKLYLYHKIGERNFVGMQTVMLYFLQRHFATGMAAWLHLYESSRKMVECIELVYDLDTKREGCKSFFMPHLVFGKENKSDAYINSIDEIRSAIDKTPRAPQRPPKGYFRNLGDTQPIHPPFDISSSKIYQAAGMFIKKVIPKT